MYFKKLFKMYLLYLFMKFTNCLTFAEVKDEKSQVETDCDYAVLEQAKK